MRRALVTLAVLWAAAGTAHAHGLLIPVEKAVPPLAMLSHKVSINIDDQVSVTHVEQVFRNHTDRDLEATYVFPVPKGASVTEFAMWVDGKKVKGELLKADQARDIYNGIVRRAQDPGLLEYIGGSLLQMKLYPVPKKGDLRVAVQFSSVANRDGNLIEYIYPLKTDGKHTATLETFSVNAVIKSQHGVSNVYSPTHAISLKRHTDKEVVVSFDKNQGLLDKDFQLFYSLGEKDVGLTALLHRPIAAEPGYVTLLISPKVEIPKEFHVPRDVVLVLDTSGSMRGPKMDQARNALNYVLKNLDKGDRFGLINFATVVNRYRDKLTEASPDQLAVARKWVDGLEATGGTAIDAALKAASEMRSNDEGRTFTIIFFTDGQPTIGETDIDKILKNVEARNQANIRIFSFGVGDDVNASFLDRLSENARALATYVRPAEDIEAKVSALYGKISNPVLANLKLSATNDIRFSEMYPAQLPDLFHGGQLVVLARYSGKGPAAIRLTGLIGKEEKEFVYELSFPEKTGDGKEFVEQLWARRKVGYLLDQIRANGEKKELVDEVVALAKKYGITTPYTSYLIVPDAPVPVAQGVGRPQQPMALGGPFAAPAPGQIDPRKPDGKPLTVEEVARLNQAAPGDLARNRGLYSDNELRKGGGGGFAPGGNAPAARAAQEKKAAFDQARDAFERKDADAYQAGKGGVDLAIQVANLRVQQRLEQQSLRQANGRNCMELGGIWIDEGFNAQMKAVTIKAQSDAYFKILEKHPKMKQVFQLGNHVVWVAPNGQALVIDTVAGKEDLSDKEIDELFTPGK